MQLPRFWYRLGMGPRVGRVFLLLTTKGRKTSRWHTIPLQYEKDGTMFYVGSARGTHADWFQNARAYPTVHVQVKNQQFWGIAKPVTHPKRVIEFVTLQIRRHPIMMRFILRMRGLPPSLTPKQIREYAASVALVSVHPNEKL